MATATTPDTALDDNMLQYDARSYQTEIVEQAKLENLIVCLPTGSGKTFIAVMLIKELSSITRRPLSDGGKRTIVLVKTVELARQHSKTMEKHLSLKTIVHAGSSKIPLQDHKAWRQEFENNQVLIFTAQTYLNLLDHNLSSSDQANLLIFDECHHATGDGPYASIMKRYEACQDHPRILGLTASISGQKLEPKNLKRAASDLRTVYHARIETGSDREEIGRNSTSVEVKHARCDNYSTSTAKKNAIVRDAFEVVKSLYDQLNKHLKTKVNQAESEVDSLRLPDSSSTIQFYCRTFQQLKSHLGNIMHIGDDLGYRGFCLAVMALTDYLNSRHTQIAITDESERRLYEMIQRTLGVLANDHRQDVPIDDGIRYSAKVIKLKEYIQNNQTGQCIVFVERVYTAAFLCQVLKEMFDGSIGIEYVAGSKTDIDGISVSAKYQREMVQEFRDGNIRVLISTAIIEEGLDVQACNLVVRFNKPPNFSSYMQSKGRARAKTGKALFVLLRDEAVLDQSAGNTEEYRNYDLMEKELRNFNHDHEIDSDSAASKSSLVPYRTANGVKIDAIRAVQIIYYYCAVLGDGQLLSPQFRFSTTNYDRFQCTLWMPKNCPIERNVECENRSKRLAKQECCLKMVEILHREGHLDERCLPILPERSSTSDENSDDEETNKIIVDKKSPFLFPADAGTSAYWYLYRINTSGSAHLGFIVPCQLPILPPFMLYGRETEFVVEVVYLKPVELKRYRNQLEAFCRYIFEEVFDEMNTRGEPILKFNIESSTFKLLPCFLSASDEIDDQRMVSVCNRKRQSISNPSELDDHEVYCISYIDKKQLFRILFDQSQPKRASDKWERKKPVETIESFADYFEYKSGIQIERNFVMATMKEFKRPRINYLKDVSRKEEKESKTDSQHFPIEVIRYALLSQADFDLIYKLPSILVRLSQLLHIEQLRKRLTRNINSLTWADTDDMPPVTFTDYLPGVLTSKRSTVLPLDSLRYDVLQQKNCGLQPSFDVVFQAVTRRSADERSDMENLEILGDCFLKLAMSLSLFHQHPTGGAGILTSNKDRQVSNANLCKLAMKQELQPYLNAHKPIYNGKEANWMPPSYDVDEPNSERYLQMSVKSKAVADMVEALIGCYLVSTDYITTMKFMQWLGLNVIPITDPNQTITPSVLRTHPRDPEADIINQVHALFDRLGLQQIEGRINYVFKNKAYLLAAFTHPSYINNDLTICYERLEYLGDAVLDFLVIRCVFVEHYEHVTPSRVTDLRQDLSNNGRLANILVSHQLHTYIQHASADLFYRITPYVESVIERSKNDSTEDDIGWDDFTAPKALADIFEAMVGAIFLDCGYSLKIVWKVIEPLLGQYINQSIRHTNLNPLRTVNEKGGKVFLKPPDGKGQVECIVELPNQLPVTGHGKNNKLAKYDACRKAIQSAGRT